MISKPSCQIVCSVLAAAGVRDAVISPGSRNTPFILALDDCESISKHVVIDERSAAFIALGIAQTTRVPVVLCCTSGTALLNYAPAIAEAYYQGVPLIVISADRPCEWIDQDDSQTLRQFEALRNYVKASYDLPDFPAEQKMQCWYANRVANDAYIASLDRRPGPVHINMHFSDPLSVEHTPIKPQRIITKVDTDTCLSPVIMKELCEPLRDKRVLVVAGMHVPSNRINRAIATLSHLPNVAVLAESVANIHTPGIVHCIDRTLLAIDTEDERYRPDVIISFGGALISRMAKVFLRRQTDAQTWCIAPMRDRIADPFMNLTRIVDVSAEVFLPHFANALARKRPVGDYNEVWREAAVAGLRRHHAKVADAPWSALRAFAYIMAHIPAKVNLQLSNGTSVRYAQLFDPRHIHACYCNRGVSGIDGSTSTAIGAATAYTHPTLLITGDMSFAYDLSALSAVCIPPDFRIIVINNSGGEIFRYIGTTNALEAREQYFSVQPAIHIGKLAAAFGFVHTLVDSEKSLRQAMSTFFLPSLSPAIMEVVVDPQISARTLTEYFK